VTGFRRHSPDLHKTFFQLPRRRRSGSGAVALARVCCPTCRSRGWKGRSGLRWLTETRNGYRSDACRASCGNAGVNLRAIFYMRMLGREGMVAWLNFRRVECHYMMRVRCGRLAGYEMRIPCARSHEFIVTLNTREYSVMG